MENWMDGFVDATGLLKGGVYVLLLRGEVVFVGRASSPMLAKIAVLRSSDRPKFLPKIQFDQILIRAEHPDRVGDLYWSLIAEFSPRHNAPAPQAVPPPIPRRPL